MKDLQKNEDYEDLKSLGNLHIEFRRSKELIRSELSIIDFV